jgi:nitrite reductase/ring-hydroxylating ferredoxin subunit
MMEMVNTSRFGVALMGLGIHRRCFLEGAIYAAHREQWGQRIDRYRMVRETLVDLLVDLEAGAAITFECAAAARTAESEDDGRRLRRILVPLAIAGAVKANSGQIFKSGSKPALLVRTPAGELRAFSAVCTHLNCTVQYRPDLSQIWCACHNGHFDLNGKNVEGPPPRPLDVFVVNARGNQIVVSRGA